MGEFYSAVSTHGGLRDLIELVDLPTNFTVRDLFCLLDSDGEGRILPNVFKTSLKLLIKSTDFHRECLMRANMHGLKGMIKAVNTRQLKEIDELADLRRELKQMKLELFGKLDALALRQSVLIDGSVIESCKKEAQGTASDNVAPLDKCLDTTNSDYQAVWRTLPLPAMVLPGCATATAVTTQIHQVNKHKLPEKCSSKEWATSVHGTGMPVPSCD